MKQHFEWLLEPDGSIQLRVDMVKAQAWQMLHCCYGRVCRGKRMTRFEMRQDSREDYIAQLWFDDAHDLVDEETGRVVMKAEDLYGEVDYDMLIAAIRV